MALHATWIQFNSTQIHYSIELNSNSTKFNCNSVDFNSTIGLRFKFNWFFFYN
jgi:hypothetical protein